jgi:23S rRNA (cytosine1962-C5)-methyltransferase
VVVGATARVQVKPRHALPLWSRDPWVLSGAVERVDGCPRGGDLVDVVAADGRWIGRGHYAPASRIAVRMVSWDAAEVVDSTFLSERIARALALRHGVLGLGGDGGTDAYRLVHAEGDGLPGLVADRLAGTVCLQAGTQSALAQLELAATEISRALPGVEIVLRHDREALEREGVTPAEIAGAAPAESTVATTDGTVVVREGGVPLVASPRRGQKTGFYTDQRENRMRVGNLSRGRRVADLFCYTGGFALHALASGAAEVVGVDSSAPALELARASVEKLAGERELAGAAAFVQGDAIEWATASARAGERYEVVIVDPPRLVKGRASLKRGLARYRRIYAAALRLAEKGGVVALFSCSGLVSEREHEDTVVAALRETDRTASVLCRLHAGADHPFRPRAGGGEYLKGLLLTLLD